MRSGREERNQRGQIAKSKCERTIRESWTRMGSYSTTEKMGTIGVNEHKKKSALKPAKTD